LLSSYAWPCEVRELHNVIERITVELADADGNGASALPVTIRT
jgi:propionate catabolism operon transcriptional regulator